jgi:hypothetical protein
LGCGFLVAMAWWSAIQPARAIRQPGFGDIGKRCRSAADSLAEKRFEISESARKAHALAGV